jgi:hypothetical protein
MMSMMMPMMMGRMMEGGAMPTMGMAEHVEGRLAFIKAELKITDAQQPQWNAFADAVRERAGREGDGHADDGPAGSANNAARTALAAREDDVAGA